VTVPLNAHYVFAEKFDRCAQTSGQIANWPKASRMHFINACD
jgi:hypothetical protein